MDEKKLLLRVQYLAHDIFINNANGKEFLKLMKYLHLTTPTYPQSLDIIDRHGGAASWAGFREGQITMIRSLQLLAQNYLDKLEAENIKENTL